MDFRRLSPKAVYLHIPFCTNKCHYCDFNSFVLKGQPVMDYLQALDREMELTVRACPPSEPIRSIFVGGGTPTVLTPGQMDFFLQSVRRHFPVWADDIEFTMEANPGTTDADKLAVMKAGGVNRISFGVQSFDNGLLQRIGRIHSRDDVYRSLETAAKTGFINLSIDLMFGLPGQTLALMKSSLEEALALDLKHYSIYSLKVEENTLFHTLYERNELPLPPEDEELQMYLAIMNRLDEAGYRQYEISNFARPGFESRHNLTYWRNEHYYGLGAGAHGYVYGERHVNAKAVREYIQAVSSGLPIIEKFAVTETEAMEDFMIVGLRLLSGIEHGRFERQFGRRLDDVFGPQLASPVGKGLLERTNTGYRLTRQGLLLGNDVFASFLGE